jgi:GT2 family glycosyltransferase
MTSNCKVWTIIPVHNRRETTRKCLDHLATLGLPKDFLICVVDDGCTDGTSEMLAKDYPTVHVLKGEGNLYWGGGIAKGMDAAREANAEVHLWLNDDCLPRLGSLERLVARVRETKGICGGICLDPKEQTKITYAGTLLEKNIDLLHLGEGHIFRAESLNGNLVAIHHEVVGKLGLLPSSRYPHFGGDIIYTHRANKADIIVEIDSLAKALNRRDDPLSKLFPNGSTTRLWKEIFRVASPLHFRTYWNQLRERFGWKAWLRWPGFFVRMLRLNFKLIKDNPL